MPATQSNVYTAAGTQFAISAVLPTTHDITGFVALSYTDIAELVDGGSAGKTFNKVSHSPLGEREELSLKGSFTQGTQDVSLGRDQLDAGQNIMRAALDSDNPYSFRITYQNGDVDYFTATVDSYTDDIGTIDTIVGATSSLARRNAKVSLIVSGVLTSAINSAGATYDTDGAFTATQASTSGTGTGATFDVVIAAGVLSSIASVATTGSGYVVADTITIAIAGSTPGTPAVIDVSTIV